MFKIFSWNFFSKSSDVSESPEAPIFGQTYSWVNPKLQVQATRNHNGWGLVATESLSKNEILIVWAGRILQTDQAIELMSTPDRPYLLQIGDGFYQAPLQTTREPADFTNHSCDPNAGFGLECPIILNAMRDIPIHEEIVFDYAMCETDENLLTPFQCYCGSQYCRGVITATDYQSQELQSRYQGYWSPHVLNKLSIKI
jgi:hypothetical protein